MVIFWESVGFTVKTLISELVVDIEPNEDDKQVKKSVYLREN